MKPRRIGLVFLLILLVGTFVFLAMRWKEPAKLEAKSKPDLADLSLLGSDQLLAKVGSVELRGHDLRDFLQMEFHGQLSHASLGAEELSLRISATMEKLIEDALLAQEALNRGLKTELKGARARHHLAHQLLRVKLESLPPVTDAELRTFYKNHGEKFYIPSGVEVRELFLALRGGPTKKGEKDAALHLATELAARIRKGESLEELSKQYASVAHRDRAKPYLFKGGVMEAADEQVVLQLQAGEVVGPLRAGGGYSIFQGIAPVRGRLIPFYQAQEKIRTHLEAPREQEVRRTLVSQLKERLPVQLYKRT